jgi:ABC-type phosphate transport system permease subunit
MPTHLHRAKPDLDRWLENAFLFAAFLIAFAFLATWFHLVTASWESFEQPTPAAPYTSAGRTWAT